MSGRSVAWLARLFRVQEVVSSNLTAPTIFQLPIAEWKFKQRLHFLKWQAFLQTRPA